MQELLVEIHSLAKRWGDITGKIDLDVTRQKIRTLEAETIKPSFWNNTDSARQVSTQLSGLQAEVSQIEATNKSFTDLLEMANLANQENQDLSSDVRTELDKLTQIVDRFESQMFLSGPYDSEPAILSIHAGQGGTEAMDWAEMMLRMYLRYFESKNWGATILDESKGEEAGIKSVTLEVNGRHAYGYLKGEAGTHRLVRQSPFNADKLRQTSFALVETLPVIAETGDIVINPDDIKMDTFRSSGAGGQNVQKVNSAVRLTHTPTGIAVSVQTERSQLQNREYAMKILRAKLWELEEAKRRGEISELKGEYRPASWGNQIRSYVLHPYHLVKDLRSGYETSDSAAVLDGELEGFIQAGVKIS